MQVGRRERDGYDYFPFGSGVRLTVFISESFTSCGWKSFKGKMTSKSTKPYFGTSQPSMSALMRVITTTQIDRFSGESALHGGRPSFRLSFGVWMIFHWLARWNLPIGNRAAVLAFVPAPAKSTMVLSHHLVFLGIVTTPSG